jgi:hypothetical protein
VLLPITTRMNCSRWPRRSKPTARIRSPGPSCAPHLPSYRQGGPNTRRRGVPFDDWPRGTGRSRWSHRVSRRPGPAARAQRRGPQALAEGTAQWAERGAAILHVVPSDDPRAVLSVIELSRAAYRKMWENLVWATGYNIITVPIAAGILAFAGITTSPAVAAILMSASTIAVALNAQLLRRLKLDPGHLARASALNLKDR